MKLPPGAPWTDVTFAGVYWHEEHRLDALLGLASRWFTHIRLGVQTDDQANDQTLAIARRYTSDIYIDEVCGYAEPTLNRVLWEVRTPWTFVISGDERPSERLLFNIGDMVYIADHGDDYSKIDAWWIRFVSSIDGVEYPSEQDNHMRLFRTNLGWPPSMHSRPAAMFPQFWHPDGGVIYHERSLDEMVSDYVRYLKMSGGNEQWYDHNRLMMHDACTATAETKGWDYVMSFPWWDEVEEKAFDACELICLMPGSGYDCRATRPVAL